MTPAQLRAARLSLGLTQQQLADQLGYNVKSVNDWECGRSPIPVVVDLALKHLKDVS